MRVKHIRGTHNKLGEGERKVRLGQDSLPNTEFPFVVLPAPFNRFVESKCSSSASALGTPNLLA